MPAIRPILAAASLIACVPAAAQEQPASTPAAIDYSSFVELTDELEEYRAGRLLPWEDFRALAQSADAVMLDSRSAEAFAAGHIAGAINLPFSDFTDAKLLQVLGSDRSRPILIYCNNNFRDDVPPVALKRVALALNIPTFINLYGYGYTNVWELADSVTIDSVDSSIGWSSNL